ncbi:MAG: exo-alpha-sialidase, partial [Dehalococcoidia bacterium]|nr:exo-alpha-sialidase [Dehalococcoidia bacterium]
MIMLVRSCRSLRGVCPVIFSLLAVLAVLVTPLLAAVPVSADWGADIRLTSAAGNSYDPSVAASGNNVHVAWEDSRDGNPEIYYKRSTNGGTTWGADTRLTSAAASSEKTSVAVSDGQVHVAWQDNRDGNEEIYYKRSTDGGTTWGADTRLTNAAAESVDPSVAATDSQVHVAWSDYRDGNGEIYYKRSTDGGATWGADTRLTNNASVSANPSVAVSGNTVHIAWLDNRDCSFEAYYKRSTDGGATWGADTRLDNDAADSRNPVLAASGNNVHIAWFDHRDGNWEIYYRRSTDAGVAWDGGTRLTSAAGDSWNASIAISGNHVHVAWEDSRDDPGREIYYKRSADGGTTWGADTRLTNAAGNTWFPSAAVSGNTVHVAWMDFRDGNWEIYYKRDTAPAPT